jgi:hypothetical protein
MGGEERGDELKTLNQVRREGLSVLAESLGPVDMIRFLRQFDMGHGDYTAERHRLLGNPTLDEIVDKIKARRKRTVPARASETGTRVHHALT